MVNSPRSLGLVPKQSKTNRKVALLYLYFGLTSHLKKFKPKEAVVEKKNKKQKFRPALGRNKNLSISDKSREKSHLCCSVSNYTYFHPLPIAFLAIFQIFWLISCQKRKHQRVGNTGTVLSVGGLSVRCLSILSFASSLPPYYQTFLSNDLHIFLNRVFSENVCYFTNQHFSKKFLSTSAREKIN